MYCRKPLRSPEKVKNKRTGPGEHAYIMYLLALCLPVLTGENAVYEVVGRKQWPSNENVLGTSISFPKVTTSARLDAGMPGFPLLGVPFFSLSLGDSSLRILQDPPQLLLSWKSSLHLSPHPSNGCLLTMSSHDLFSYTLCPFLFL